ncbi:hypothetical protein [Bdellovibrio sp. HCB2-146]|uniref:hypothetical protein n=1 Tax=Bdellovibrio sp. HCB2-146 TaxID=3394362 RepID=UPI0039BCD538
MDNLSMKSFCLLLAISISMIHIQSNACSRKITYYEKHEGNTLKYWTAGQVGALTLLASTAATITESSDTNKVVPGFSAVALYVVACFGVGYPDHVDLEWIEAHPETKDNFVPKPTSAEEIAKIKKEFYHQQAEYDRRSTIFYSILNAANGLVAREPASQVIGIGGALVNILYYWIDPNDTREIGSQSVTSFFQVTSEEAKLGIAVNF